MLGYLKGRILDNAVAGEGVLTLGVGSPEQGIVGYSVRVPRQPDYELLPQDKIIELFIHTHVREDALDLYGFATRLEKELFLTLLSVNGIGPRGALSILSGTDPAALIQAIIDGEKETLTRIPGIGKKTAERVVLELAEPLRKKMLLEGAAGSRPSSGPASGATAKDHGRQSQPQALKDAVSALVGLGYRETDVAPLVSRALAESSGRDSRPKAEDLIRAALRQLA